MKKFKIINMKTMKHVAWLSCGVVLAYLAFDVMSVLVKAGAVEGKYQTLILSVLISSFIGVLLCWRASTRAILQLGLTIATYLPALYLLIWLVAITQDLIRWEGLPGDSIKIMMDLPPTHMLMAVMVITGITVSLSGLLTKRVVLSLRNQTQSRNNLKYEAKP